jgi:hypothetical protein
MPRTAAVALGRLLAGVVPSRTISLFRRQIEARSAAGRARRSWFVDIGDYYLYVGKV